jgi:hypothetical protein
MIIDDKGLEKKENISENNSNTNDIRLQLLYLAKDILQHRETMRWETHKQINNINVDDVIESAKKLYKFVSDGKNA